MKESVLAAALEVIRSETIRPPRPSRPDGSGVA